MYPLQEATLSAELSAKEELKSLLEQTRRDYQQEKDMLSLQVCDSAGLGMWYYD